MKISKKQANVLYDAIEQWQKDAVIDDATGDKLRKSVIEYKDDYANISFYAFIGAVSCGILAFGALVLDEKWIERMRRFFEFSEFIIVALFAALSVLFIWMARRRFLKYNYAKLANESFTILIALCSGVAVAYLVKGLRFNADNYGYGILLAAVIYLCVAVYIQSKLMWMCFLLALVAAWGALTYGWSYDQFHAYFLGMNYPLRMTLFGLIIIGGSLLLQKNAKFQYFHKLTFYSGWVLFLLSGLVLSTSGNLTFEIWSAVKQGRLVAWAVGYTLVLSVLIYYVIKSKDETLRYIVIAFFLLNIYVRYFEYFWDRTNKGLFFLILALSFWFVGRKAEQMRKKLID